MRWLDSSPNLRSLSEGVPNRSGCFTASVAIPEVGDPAGGVALWIRRIGSASAALGGPAVPATYVAPSGGLDPTTLPGACDQRRRRRAGRPGPGSAARG